MLAVGADAVVLTIGAWNEGGAVRGGGEELLALELQEGSEEVGRECVTFEEVDVLLMV